MTVLFLQKPSASPALNDYLSLKPDCENPKKTFIWVGRLEFIARYFHRPLMWSGMWYRPVSLLLQLVSGRINFSPPHRPLVYLKVFIVLSRLCCTMSMISMEKQPNSLCPRSIKPRLTTGQLDFEPASFSLSREFI